MNQFFQVVIILSVFAALLYISIIVKNFHTILRSKRKIQIFRDRDYFDRKMFHSSFIRVQLDKLKNGEILWLEVRGGEEFGDRISLNRLSENKNVILKFKAVNLDEHQIYKIKEMGIADFKPCKNKVNHLILPYNAKMITDVLYFILENVFENDRIFTLKFNY